MKAEALAGGATREPTIERIDGANAMVNDADLTRRLAGVLERELGRSAWWTFPPGWRARTSRSFRRTA